jgi:hypothetical protein
MCVRSCNSNEVAFSLFSTRLLYESNAETILMSGNREECYNVGFGLRYCWAHVVDRLALEDMCILMGRLLDDVSRKASDLNYILGVTCGGKPPHNSIPLSV